MGNDRCFKERKAFSRFSRFSFVALIIIFISSIEAVTDKNRECIDNDERCLAWARKGDCHKNRDWMFVHCRLSCKLCRQDTLKAIASQGHTQLIYAAKAVGVVFIGLFLVALRLYFVGGVCTSRERMDGKVAIVTGGTSPIAIQVAMSLAWRGARVILACRNVKKGMRAMSAISKAAKSDNVEVKRLDLSSFKSVRKFATEIQNDTGIEAVDVLINNASVTPNDTLNTTDDGLELCFQVNYVGHFLLTNLLMSQIEAAKDGGRVIHITSNRHENLVDLDIQKLISSNSYNKWKAFDSSKLCLTMFSVELAGRFEGTTSASIVVHPGYMMSALSRNVPIFGHIFGRIFLKAILGGILMLCCKSPRQASETIIEAAVRPNANEWNGKYLKDCKPFKLNKIVDDEPIRRKLWEITERLIAASEDTQSEE